MGLTALVRSFHPSASQLVISLLIAGLGWLSGQALSRVDHDLRIIYAEYTLGATDLAHISADVMRYQNTIIRALEADSREDFERITESLPVQRAGIQHAVDCYAAAGLRVSRSGRSEPEDIEAVRRTSFLLVGGSIFIAFLNLFLTRQRGGTSRQVDGPPDEPEINPRPKPVPLPLAGAPQYCALSSLLLGHPIAFHLDYSLARPPEKASPVPLR